MKKESNRRIVAYVDGSCRGNPGPSGWAAILKTFEGDREVDSRSVQGTERDSTNQRAELLAAIGALEAIPANETVPIEIVSDSEYVVLGANGRVAKWIEQKALLTRPNHDLWLRLVALLVGRAVTFTWVRGHSGHAGNEEANLRARLALAA